MTRGRWIILWVMLFAAIGKPVFADGAITLPLQGYFRVGRYMPVRIASASDGQMVRGSGVVPVRIQTALPPADQVVPVLMTSASASLAAPVQLHPLDEGQLLVGLVGAASEPEARRLFPNREVIPIHLDWPLAKAAYAWEALDAIVIVDTPPPKDATIAGLLGNGTDFFVRLQNRPDQRWPWQQEGAFWTLRYDPLGPRDCFAEPSAVLASYDPGISAVSRGNIMVFATIFVILTLGATLLRGKSRLITIACIAISSLIAIYGWINTQPAARTAGGDVTVISADLLQEDFWWFQAGLRTNTAHMNGSARPMLSDWSDASAMDLTLVWRDDPAIPLFEYRTSPGKNLAFLTRVVLPRTANMVSAANNLHRSPLRPLVDATYLKNGARIVGEGFDRPPRFGATFDNWPGVTIDRPSSVDH